MMRGLVKREWRLITQVVNPVNLQSTRYTTKTASSNNEEIAVMRSASPCDNSIVPVSQVKDICGPVSKDNVIFPATNIIPDNHTSWLPSPYTTTGKTISQYKKLSKFRLTSLVVVTTMGGYAMAPAAFDLSSFAMCTLGTGMISAAANAINQYHEVPFDSQMSRTKNRVLVTGQITPLKSVLFAAVSASTGLCMLYFGVNGLTAALGAGNLFLYTSIYTPMKRISIVNTWIGSVVGAIPPLMGWAGCAGSLDSGAMILAGILFAWQFPHFNALSWNLRPDYSRAGYRMMAVTNPSLCRRTALRYSLVIAGLSLMAPVLDVTNYWFALETIPLNAYFAYLAYKFNKKSDSKSSRSLFRFSLLHLPALMLLFLANKKEWYFKKNAEEETIKTDSNYMVLKPSKTATSLGNVLPVAVAEGPR
ncbi:protoheme IX farnesyltransferase, mitochondrial [Drosophila miranda]|uniref:protoheme IX farnesyltransferase, mitochondrial n=1 Tax=Drosophila miranda TaxID=7229 RepID=UPI0007E8350F|nr:protoheme IX farnesyltransferase, mitochondrial [Drosophila miranda]